MNKTRFMPLIMLIACALACQILRPPLTPATPTAAPTSSAVPDLLHFENEWIALDYPGDWTAYPAGDPTFASYPPVPYLGDMIAGLGPADFERGGTYYRLLRITRLALPVGESLEQIMQARYHALEEEFFTGESVFVAPETTTVGGITAYQRCYRVFWGEPAYDLRDVWVPHGDALYIIAISTQWSNRDALTEFNAVADGILRSLVIK